MLPTQSFLSLSLSHACYCSLSLSLYPDVTLSASPPSPPFPPCCHIAIYSSQCHVTMTTCHVLTHPPKHMLSQTPVVSVHTDAGSGGIILHVISGCQSFLQELSGTVSLNIVSRGFSDRVWIQMFCALSLKSYSNRGSGLHVSISRSGLLHWNHMILVLDLKSCDRVVFFSISN